MSTAKRIELIAKIAVLAAELAQLEAENDAVPPEDPWFAGEDLERLYKIKMRVVTEAHARGEIEIGHAGRSPRVRRSVLDRWLTTRASKKPVAVTDEDEIRREIADAKRGKP